MPHAQSEATISVVTLLCESATTVELEAMAKKLRCTDLHWLYGSLHLRLPDGARGSFRSTHAAALGVSGHPFTWCPYGDRLETHS